jgi:hypothetical protein
MDKPAPPPEATLIGLARKAAGLSVPAAVRRTTEDVIGQARWSQIESGYENKAGRPVPVRGRDDTVAHMSFAVGVTPEELEDAGRPDAADVLRIILRQQEKLHRAMAAIEEERHYSDARLQQIWDIKELPIGVRKGLIRFAEGYLADQDERRAG